MYLVSCILIHANWGANLTCHYLLTFGDRHQSLLKDHQLGERLSLVYRKPVGLPAQWESGNVLTGPFQEYVLIDTLKLGAANAKAVRGRITESSGEPSNKGKDSTSGATWAATLFCFKISVNTPEYGTIECIECLKIFAQFLLLYIFFILNTLYFWEKWTL